MSITSRLMRMIRNGREGNNMGLTTGLKKLDKLTYGIQRSWLTVVAGGSGSGKSSFTLFSYVYQPLKLMLGDPRLKIIYFSFEMSQEVLMAKLLSMHILDRYKVRIRYSEILSFGDKLSDDKFKYIEMSATWMEEVEKHLIIFDKQTNAKGVETFLINYLKDNGEFKDISESQVSYIPKIKNQYNIVIVDHVRLLSGKPKEEIDALCDSLVYLRNLAGLTIVLVQQINRDSQSMERRKGGYEMIQLSDLADSSAPAQSAETVIALFHPSREKLAVSGNYDIKALGDFVRIIQLLKNRFGEADKAIGSIFYGYVGVFSELPRADEISDYETYKDINYYLNGDQPKVDIKIVDRNKEKIQLQ